MNKNLVKDENHITIHGWMSTKLKLAGNELIIYALIYGFSQVENHNFHGSLQYICDWTNISKNSCIDNLKKLISKNLITKQEKEINGLKFCEYSTNLYTIQETCMGIQETLTNNINNNIDNTNIDKSILVDNVENDIILSNKIKSLKDTILNENIKCIIDYLNETAGTNYKYNTKGTVNLLKARFKEGYQLDDFYDVIDKKWKDWRNTEFEQYMRPSTLFGNKFENYLNSTIFKGKPKTSYGSKPTFDNTANHKTGNPKISDEELDKMDFESKRNYVMEMDYADMTPKQKDFFTKNCLAMDENGNLLKF